MSCSLTDFKLPEPDVRLVKLDDTVYKIKLRFRANNLNWRDVTESRDAFWSQANVQYDIERVIKYVLHNPGNIDPIRTDDLVIYPYMKDWPNADRLEFSKFKDKLKSSPNLFLFYIERIKTKTSEKTVSLTPGVEVKNGKETLTDSEDSIGDDDTYMESTPKKKVCL